MNRSVLLVGKVLEVKGSLAILEASDGGRVTVNTQPGTNITAQYIEVLARVVDNETVSEMQVREFPNDCDMGNYNELVQLMNGPYKDLFE